MMDPSESVRLLNKEKTVRTVLIGIQFDRIGEIDTMNEKFYAELTIEAKWAENKIIGSFNPETEWNPRLYIEVTSKPIGFFYWTSTMTNAIKVECHQ
jgi:hypothetical protein